MAGVGPDAEQEASFFRQHGLGPGETAARITGTVAGEKQEDDKVIPSPNPPHSKNVGGIAVANDALLFQKLQMFNRSKTQERRKLLYSALFIFFPSSPNLKNGVGVVHAAGSGAFGYFECTKDMSKLTKVLENI